MQSDHDFDVLAVVAAEGRAAGCAVGAGTVVGVDLHRRAAEAGAAFTVAPGLDTDVARAALQADLPHLPGVATATEVHHALRLGFRWQKAFPAAELGPSWITAMSAPFSTVRFVATGGISSANAPAFLDAGAGAVSLGSSFARDDDDAIRQLIARG